MEPGLSLRPFKPKACASIARAPVPCAGATSVRATAVRVSGYLGSVRLRSSGPGAGLTDSHLLTWLVQEKWSRFLVDHQGGLWKCKVITFWGHWWPNRGVDLVDSHWASETMIYPQPHLRSSGLAKKGPNSFFLPLEWSKRKK